MKAKTIYQKNVMAVSEDLRPITQKQSIWALKKCLLHKGFRLKSGKTSCLDCGHQWITKPELKKSACPGCAVILTIETTRKTRSSDKNYFTIADVCKNNQVIRHFKVTAEYRSGKPMIHTIREVSQIWLNSKGQFAIRALLNNVSFYCDTWTGEFEIRNPNALPKYNFLAEIYPGKKILPEIKRAGYKSSTYGASLFYIFISILLNPKSETLLKSGQGRFVAHANDDRINQYWRSLKICMRNSYIISRPKLWMDYIDLLAFFDKDLSNAKYVCPDDLNREHDMYVRRKTRVLEQRMFERRAKTMTEAELIYQKSKQKFFDLEFDEENIVIKPLTTVQQFREIGKSHNLCLFSNEYFRKKRSLVFAATLNGQIIEIIDVCLSAFYVKENLGAGNQPTEYNKTIREIMSKNMHQIEKRFKAA